MRWFKKTAGVTSSPRVQPTIERILDLPSGAFPVLDQTTMLEQEKSLISRIRLTAGMSDEVFNQLYMPLLSTYSRFVMSLPASRASHHFRPGGMWQYALEVGLLSLQTADSKIFSGSEPVEHRHILEPRWRIAAFCAGLLMDVGAVISHMRVLGRDGERWEPLLLPLATWVKDKGLDFYYVQWLPSDSEAERSRHRLFSGVLAARLLSLNLQAYLVEGSTAILHELVLAISGLSIENSQNTLLQMIDQSRNASIERDTKARGGLVPTGTVGLPVESYILDGLRYLARAVWAVNQAGSPLWVTRHGVFIHWERATAELRRWLKGEGIGAIPLEPSTLADILITHHIAVRPPPGRPHDVYWCVDMPGSGKVSAIRLSASEVLFGASAPEPVDIPITSFNNGYQGESNKDPEKIVPNVLPKTVEPDQALPLETKNVEEGVSAEPNANTLEASPARKQKGRDVATISSAGVNSSEESKTPKRPPRRTAGEALAWLRKQGKAGELIAALGEDCKEGKKRVGIEVFWMDTGLAVVFPAGLTGYGFDPAKALEVICDKGWAVKDQKNNRSVLHDIANSSGAKTRALVLSPTVGTAVAAIADIEHPGAAGKRVPSKETPPPTPVTSSFMPRTFFDKMSKAAMAGTLPFAVAIDGEGVRTPFPDAFEWYVSGDERVTLKELANILTRKEFVIPSRGMSVIVEDGKKSRIVFRREFCDALYGWLLARSANEGDEREHVDQP